MPESLEADGSLRASLNSRAFVVGLALMLVGTVIEEFALSRNRGGDVSSPLPLGIVAAVVSGLAVGWLTKEPELSVFRGFVAGYISAILGAAVFAALYWGTMPEAGVAGWTVFFVGGLIVGVAIGWLSALASAASAYFAALFVRTLSRRGSASAK